MSVELSIIVGYLGLTFLFYNLYLKAREQRTKIMTFSFLYFFVLAVNHFLIEIAHNNGYQNIASNMGIIQKGLLGFLILIVAEGGLLRSIDEGVGKMENLKTG